MKNLNVNRDFIFKLFKVKLSEIRDDLKSEFQDLDYENIQKKLYNQSAGYNRLISLIVKQTKEKSELLLESIFESINNNDPISERLKIFINDEIRKLIDREILEKQHFLSDRLHANNFSKNTIKTFIRNLLYNASILKGDFVNKIFVNIEKHNETVRRDLNAKLDSDQENIIPDLDWYIEKSLKMNLLPRCPFGLVSECPRYYQSLSLLGNYGSTSIPINKEKKLQKKWEKSPYWPVIPENATSVSGSEDGKTYSLFCPEVSYERFKLFALNLIDYPSIEEKETYIEELTRDSKLHSNKDWRYQWAYIEPFHYSACSY